MRDSLVGDGKLFEPDILLPAQHAIRARRLALDPSQRLVVAMFEDALECFQKHWAATDRKMRALHDSAREWIWSEEREWPYSFLNVCALLSLDAGYVRTGLEIWLDRQKRHHVRGKVVALKKHAQKPTADRALSHAS